MSIGLNPAHIKPYGDIALLFLKHGQGDLVREIGLDEALRERESEETEAAAADAADLVEDLERLGPTFVKLGQLLSTRPDLLPPQYIAAFSRLQDRLDPFSFDEVQRIVAEELGTPIDKAFSEFDPEPIAAASLGQVHRAALHGGRDVVVKVQRPGIRKQVAADLEVLREIAGFAERRTEIGRRYGFLQLFDTFRGTILQELDYEMEAQNLATLARNLAGFERLAVPEAVADYTTPRVLTMEYIRGRKITELSPLAHMEIDGAALADDLFKAYLKQILLDGFFHADPHPGNVFLTDDGRIALLDVGMVGRIPRTLQNVLLRLMLAIGDGDGEEAARAAILIGRPMEGKFEEEKFTREVTQLVALYEGATAEDIELGQIVIRLTRSAAASGLLLPGEVSMLGRTFLALDHVGRTLDPRFDPNQAVRRHSADVLREQMLRSVSRASVLRGLLETSYFVQRLPGRLGRILETVADNQVEVRIRLEREKWLLEGLQKISNRITMGLVLAALIVGAAMLMRVETRFRILGYPGLAMLLFIAAATLGLALVLSIWVSDVRDDGGD